MALSEMSIHLMNREIPEVEVQEYSNFCVVKIGTDLKVMYFLYSPQQVTNFKNNLLWAFEKPVKITE